MYIFVTDLPCKKNSSSSWLNFSISKTNVHKWSAYFALLVVDKYLCHVYTLWANNLVDKTCFNYCNSGQYSFITNIILLLFTLCKFTLCIYINGGLLLLTKNKNKTIKKSLLETKSFSYFSTSTLHIISDSYQDNVSHFRLVHVEVGLLQ